MAILSVLWDILQRPTIASVLSELVMFMAPIWIAVVVGVVVGWAWRPKWAILDCSNPKQTSLSLFTPSSYFTSLSLLPSFNSLKLQLPSYISWSSEDGREHESISSPPNSISSSSHAEKGVAGLVTEEDLEHLCRLVEGKDGGPEWIKMMDRSTKNMGYQAWRRDPETGPPQYCSRTIFEDASPEVVRDFFWDDEFRLKWDDMLLHAETLDDCQTTGAMRVQWVRKFPFFCSDREYIIGRRIWESGCLYYCVTKGVPCFSVLRRNNLQRVDLYYSSWCIRAVESKRDGQLTASEVLLFHHEDMGIPGEIAKLGIRLGMWGAVKKIEPGLRVYQKQRASGSPLSRCAFMAQINTKVSADYLRSLESSSNRTSGIEVNGSCEKQLGRNIPKLLVIGGAVVVACSLDRGLLTKALIFGVARRFAKMGRRL